MHYTPGCAERPQECGRVVQEHCEKETAAEISPVKSKLQKQSQQLNAFAIAPTQSQCVTKRHERHGQLLCVQTVASSGK